MEHSYPLPPHAARCLAVLRGAGYRACPVGGCVRDLLLGRTPGDWDVASSAPPEAVLSLFPRAALTGGAHGTVTVVLEGGSIEVTPFRREEGYSDSRHPDRVEFGTSLEEDLSRRDFTVNAMALDGDTLIDPFGGQEDLRRGVLRCVGDPERRFGEDALRMLRAVRFSAQLGFAIEARTRRAMADNAARTALVSRERIRAELEKTLLSPRPEAAEEMIRLGLLDHLFSWDKAVSLASLGQAEPTPAGRWRAFCAATGFPISALPVERALRQAVEHPERALIPTLALTPADLMAFGLSGPQLGAAQRALALHLLDHPEDNRRDALLARLSAIQNRGDLHD